MGSRRGGSEVWDTGMPWVGTGDMGYGDTIMGLQERWQWDMGYGDTWRALMMVTVGCGVWGPHRLGCRRAGSGVWSMGSQGLGTGDTGYGDPIDWAVGEVAVGHGGVGSQGMGTGDMGCGDPIDWAPGGVAVGCGIRGCHGWGQETWGMGTP